MAKATVLLVDDDAAIRDLMSCILEDEYTVLQADDQRSLQHGLDAQPGIVLLDLAMPHLDAGAISRNLRENAATAHIPIVVVSAYGPCAAPPGMIADAWVEKPFSVDQFCHVVGKWSGTAD